jgi:hypothetical protein
LLLAEGWRGSAVTKEVDAMTMMILVLVVVLCAAALATRRTYLHRRHAQADQRETRARALRHSWR